MAPHCLLEYLCFSVWSMNPPHFPTSLSLHVLFPLSEIPFFFRLLYQNLTNYSSSFLRSQLNSHFLESFPESSKLDGDPCSVFANLCFMIPCWSEWVHVSVIPEAWTLNAGSTMHSPLHNRCSIDIVEWMIESIHKSVNDWPLCQKEIKTVFLVTYANCEISATPAQLKVPSGFMQPRAITW